MATVVFDGYAEGPSIKDDTHVRCKGSKIGLSVNFTAYTINRSKKEEFLANKNNKQKFINLLSESLKQVVYNVLNAGADADLFIVKTAVELAESARTVVVGDDTDLLILLCYHSHSEKYPLTFTPEAKMKSSKNRSWDIQTTKAALGPVICSKLLFLHALLVCDSTSHPFGIGKGTALLKVVSNENFSDLAEKMSDGELCKEDIVMYGEKALLMVYNGSQSDRFDTLRYKRFCEKVAKSSKYVEPQTLPPISAAA